MSASVLKSITSFIIQEFPGHSQKVIEAALEKVKFRPCAASDWESIGFVPAFDGGVDEPLALEVEGAYWVQLQTEKKILPSSVVKRIFKERLLKREQEYGRKIGRKEQKELKQEIIDELLPRALTGQSSILAVIDPKMGFVLVGESSAKKAEFLVTMLNRALDSLRTAMVDYPESTSGAMADLLLGKGAELFAAETSLTLKGSGTSPPTVKFAQYPLAQKEVLDLLKEGMRPSEIELSWEGRLSFVLTDKFVLKKVNFLMAAGDEPDEEVDDPAMLLRAMLTLQIGELRLVFKDFAQWLGKPGVAGQHTDARNEEDEHVGLAHAAE